MEWTRRTISDATRDWLAALPEHRVERDVTLVHGSPRDPTWEYVTSLTIARAGIEVMTTTLGLHGHTHVPIAFATSDGRLEMVAPSDGSSFDLEDRVALSTRAASASPATATRGRATSSWIPTPARSRGTGSTTTSRP